MERGEAEMTWRTPAAWRRGRKAERVVFWRVRWE